MPGVGLTTSAKKGCLFLPLLPGVVLNLLLIFVGVQGESSQTASGLQAPGAGPCPWVRAGDTAAATEVLRLKRGEKTFLAWAGAEQQHWKGLLEDEACYPDFFHHLISTTQFYLPAQH